MEKQASETKTGSINGSTKFSVATVAEFRQFKNLTVQNAAIIEF